MGVGAPGVGDAAGAAAAAGAEGASAAAVGAEDAAGVGDAFVSSAHEVASLADTRIKTNPIRVNKRIWLRQFSIVWIVIELWFLVKADGTGSLICR